MGELPISSSSRSLTRKKEKEKKKNTYFVMKTAKI